MAAKVRIGIIGTGAIARGAHMANYAKLDDVEIVAVCDADEKAMNAAAEQYGVPKRYADYRDIAADPDIDAVSVCTPNFMHKDPTVACLRAGKHVLVEKPIAMNAAEGAEMVRAAEESGRVLAVGLHFRYDPSVEALRRFRDEGGFGDVYYSRVHILRRRGIPGWGCFGDKARQGGGAMVDIGVHYLYIALYVMGFPKPVSAAGAIWDRFGSKPPGVAPWGVWDHENFTVEDYAAAFVRFEGGMAMSIEASFAANIEGCSNVWIMGDRGGAQLEPLKIYREEFGMLTDSTPGWMPKNDCHASEIRDFVAAARGEGAAGVTGAEGLAVTRIIDAVYRSAELGREVAVETAEP